MITILVVCTGNSCRSVLGEALFNHYGEGRVKAYSAGSSPIGKTNENALKTLRRHAINAEGFTSESWHEYEHKAIDIAITVCDNAANEPCPVYLNAVVRAHWGVSDPAHLQGSEAEVTTAFEQTFAILERRVKRMLDLPLETLSSQELTQALSEIGQDKGQK